MALCLVHSRRSVTRTPKDNPPAYVQDLQTYSPLAPRPTFDFNLCVLASKAGEGWRVPTKAQRPGGMIGAKDAEACQERASSRTSRAHLDSHPIHKPLFDALPSLLVYSRSKEQGIWDHHLIPALSLPT